MWLCLAPPALRAAQVSQQPIAIQVLLETGLCLKPATC
jgi:hypothetical protein